MTDFTDLPIIQLHPTPTDAELEAERDAKHAQAVAEWQEHQSWTRDYYDVVPMDRRIDAADRAWTPLRPMSCPCAMCDHIPPEAVQG